MLTIIFLLYFLFFNFLSHSHAESKCLLLNSRNGSKSFLFSRWRWCECIYSNWHWFLNSLSCDFFSAPFLTSSISWSFFFFLFVPFLSCPWLFWVSFNLCLRFSLSFSFFTHFNKSCLIFSCSYCWRFSHCSSNSADSLKGPFWSHLTFIFSHFCFFLFLLLFIFFSQCFSTCDNFFFVIIRKSLFKVNHFLIVLFF